MPVLCNSYCISKLKQNKKQTKKKTKKGGAKPRKIHSKC